jgi:hypothetical protein
MFFRPSVYKEIILVSSGSFFMEYISSYADVASKSPVNSKLKPWQYLSTVISKFKAIAFFIPYWQATNL